MRDTGETGEMLKRVKCVKRAEKQGSVEMKCKATVVDACRSGTAALV
jgi:hypothetical protein